MEKRSLESQLLCMIDDVINHKICVASFHTNEKDFSFSIKIWPVSWVKYQTDKPEYVFKERILKLLSMLMEGAINKQIAQEYKDKLSTFTFMITDITLFNDIERFRKNPFVAHIK